MSEGEAKMDNIEFMGKIYNQIVSKIDMDKPFPQNIEVEYEANLICEKPRCSFVIIQGEEE